MSTMALPTFTRTDLASSGTVGDFEITERPLVTSPESAADVLVPLIGDLDREAFVLLSLDTKHRLLAHDIVSLGSVDHTFMAPRETFRTALLRGASAVILSHNHPSGEAAPSDDDRAVTRRLASAGDLLGIDVLDHLVIGTGRWVSMARRGEV